MDIAEYKKTIVALRPTLIAVANRITRNTEDAEDVTMTKNLSIDKIRTRRPVSDEDGFIGKTDNGRLPDELLEERDNKEAIRRIIMSLPPLQQRIFQLKDLEGYETEEIVEITGIAAEAVRNNLSRARKRLRELYLAYHRIKEKKA